MTASGRSSRFTLQSRAVAITLSVVLHAAVLTVVGRLGNPGTLDIPVPPTSVVWLGELRLPPEPPPIPSEAPADEPPQSEPIEPEPPAQTRVEAPDEPPPEPEPAAEEAPVEEAPAERPAVAATEDEARASEALSPTVPDDIDWEAAKEQTVAAIMTELERRSGRITFSTGDGDDEADPLRPAPGAIFDAPRSPKRRIGSPGQARTRVGRFAAELCNALTGGFGLGGILSPLGISVCSDEAVYAKYFAHLKPDYMRKRPVCEEPESLDPLMAEISRQNGIPTIKCRLVPADEVDAAIGGSADPAEDLWARE